LGNWSVSFKNTVHFFGVTQTCEVRADVISLVPLPKFIKPGREITFNQLKSDEIVKGDSVEFNIETKTFIGVVLNSSGSTFKLLYFDPELNTNATINKFKKDLKPIKK